MSNNKIISWIIKVGLLIIPVLPLVVITSLYFPFITGRNFIFRIIVEILFVLWVWLMMKDISYRPRSSVILYSAIAWIAVLFLATVLACLHIKVFGQVLSGWKGFGVIGIILCISLCLLVFLKRKGLAHFFGVSLVTSLVIGLYSVMQMLGFLDIHQGDDRIDATMGNATYLAIYIVFHIFSWRGCFLGLKVKISFKIRIIRINLI